MLKIAQELRKLGPVHPLRADPNPRDWGKVPSWKRWQKRALDLDAANDNRDWETATGVGLLTGEVAGFFVLDIDPRSGGDETLASLEAKHATLPETLTTMTGSGGLHFYFRWPDFEVTSKAHKLGRGLDVKGKGGYVVGAGSKHSSGAVYAWAPERGPREVDLADAPPWLLDMLRPAAPKEAAQTTAPAPMDGDPAVLARAVSKLATIPGAVQGSGGSDPTFFAALTLVRGLSLSDDTALALLQQHYNPRCSPPWSEKELRHKIASAREKGKVPFGYLLKPRGRQDRANGDRLAFRHGHLLCYCKPLKTWFVWDGARWAPDETEHPMRLAKETARSIADEAKDADENEAPKLLHWAAQSQMAPRLAAMIALAQSELPVRSYELDRDPWLLNVENGTLNLQTGELHQHRRSDLLTKVAPYPYLPDAACPLWTAFLAKVQPDADVRAFLQRLFGYALTGDVAEEIFTVIQGDGQRGKSTLLNTIQAVMGEYAVTPQPGIVLSADRHADPERATPELMKLRGARLAVAYETAHGVTLDDAKVKRAASTDTIAARGLHKDAIEFVPTHKLILATNHKPRVVATDWGTWRRVCLVPFNVTITEEEKDVHFKERLRAEYPGILAWLVEGCALWRKEGKLIIPTVLQNFRDEYRKAEDTLGQFVTECLDLRAEASATKQAVYAEYQQWTRDNGITNQMSQITLDKRIEETWHGRVSSKRTKTARLWVGLGVKPLGVKGQEAAKMAAQAGVSSPPETAPKARKRTRRTP